jgi:uridine kinase
MQTLLGEHGAYLDRIYYCPHHPDSGFDEEVKALKKVCDCRKPAIGMLTQAQKELNADFGASWMIGDSTTDILAAQAAGVRSILLQTGNAGLDEKYPVVPNHISPNLPAAVRYILHEHPRLLQQCESWSKDIAPGDLVLIGGLSRSGKSTLAHCLQEALQVKGVNSQILSADGWLRSSEHRGQNVSERYDINTLDQLAQALIDRKGDLMIQVPMYSKRELTAKRSIGKVIAAQDVVIIEGTIALLLAVAQAKKSVHCWYVQADEERRKKRVLGEYALRGKSPQEAQNVYSQRQIDEAPFIESSMAQASRCIDLELRSDLP